MLKILIVDDDPNIRKLISLIVKRNPNSQVSEAESVKDALSLCNKNKYDLIFLDHNVVDGVGWIISNITTLDPRDTEMPSSRQRAASPRCPDDISIIIVMPWKSGCLLV